MGAHWQKKKNIIIAACLIVIMMVSGCGGGIDSKNTDISADEVMAIILNSVSFETELEKKDKNFSSLLFGIEDSDEAVCAVGSSTVADMAAVIKGGDAGKALRALQSYLDSMIDEYKKYNPDQVSKLENAVTIKSGNMAVLCVTNDYENAKKVIESALEGKITPPNPFSSSSSSSQDVSDSSSSSSEILDPPDENSSSYPAIAEKGDFKDFGSIVASGDTGFECYAYMDDMVTSYTNAVNSFASRIPASAKFYSMIIPLSSGITLPDSLMGKIHSSDQNESIAKVNEKLGSNMTKILLYNTLMSHRDEYIYFRTDHHWTALGAYYAYSQFLKAKGLEAPDINTYKTVTFDGFLGTFYNDSGKSDILSSNPDFVTAYYPVHNDSISMECTDTNGKNFKWKVISDVSNYNASNKYGTFAGGDNPIAIITNTDITDGSVCILIKESFGNALVPFLADNYQTIIEVDYRYYNGSIHDLISQNPRADILLANNLSVLQGQYTIGKLANFLG